MKETISYVMAAVSLLGGFVLLFMGYLAPPEGEISASVLYAFGETLLFTGSILGISIHCRTELRNFNETVRNLKELEKKVEK